MIKDVVDLFLTSVNDSLKTVTLFTEDSSYEWPPEIHTCHKWLTRLLRENMTRIEHIIIARVVNRINEFSQEVLSRRKLHPGTFKFHELP